MNIATFYNTMCLTTRFNPPFTRFFLRDALRYWIKQCAVDRFEADWIAALKSDQPEYSDDTELWMAAEAWDVE
ncbi:MAG: hypothetical protein ACLFMZ_00520 [Spirochaetaceae bacterium]